ncbi:hypothetical protein R4Z10_15810 [Niallia sp. XMNu-256]|uniref:hypothetical protein n=1 Tax=Niallia sp. XMNu-256 TaxID=3082444 RepID=UPI0030D416A2
MTKIIENIVPFQQKRKFIHHLNFTPGIWINGKTHWLKKTNEMFLISDGISVKMNQRSTISKVNYFDMIVTNHGKKERHVKLLMMYHHPNQKKEHISFISPVDKVIYHVSGGLIYLVNGMHNGNGFNHYTIQSRSNISSNSFWDCQEKGILNYRPMYKGSAASIKVFDLKIGARDIQKCSTWSISGNNKIEITELNNRLLKTY